MPWASAWVCRENRAYPYVVKRRAEERAGTFLRDLNGAPPPRPQPAPPLPARGNGEMRRIHERIDQISASQARLEGEVHGMKSTLDLIHEYLLHGGRK